VHISFTILKQTDASIFWCLPIYFYLISRFIFVLIVLPLFLIRYYFVFFFCMVSYFPFSSCFPVVTNEVEIDVLLRMSACILSSAVIVVLCKQR
jgi:hypothetical protein